MQSLERLMQISINMIIIKNIHDIKGKRKLKNYYDMTSL